MSPQKRRSLVQSLMLWVLTPVTRSRKPAASELVASPRTSHGFKSVPRFKTGRVPVRKPLYEQLQSN